MSPTGGFHSGVIPARPAEESRSCALSSISGVCRHVSFLSSKPLSLVAGTPVLLQGPESCMLHVPQKKIHGQRGRRSINLIPVG